MVLLDFERCAVFSKGFWDSCVDTVKAVFKAVVLSSAEARMYHSKTVLSKLREKRNFRQSVVICDRAT